MPFFHRFKLTSRRTPAPLDLRIGRGFGDPEAVAVIAAMTAGDWPAARRILDAGHPQDDFDFLLGAAAEVDGVEEWLPDRIRDDGDDLLASLVFGARLVTWAWAARTGARAQDVTDDRWAVFRERLQQAEEVLQEVVRRDASTAAAWSALIITATGLSRPLAELRERFDRTVAIDPHNFTAHQRFLQGACAKWQGSDAIMHEFARTAARTAPAGSRLGVLIPLAHCESWLSAETQGRPGYFRSPSVARDLVEAADRSVLHPAYERRRNWAADNNPFAAAFSLAGDWPRARRQFEILGGLGTQTPWAYFTGGPENAYLRMYYRAHTK